MTDDLISSEIPYATLTPDHVLDAIESLGYQCDGRVLALNSYENRVYQIGLEDHSPIVAKFYRPGRWALDTILEEHDFAAELVEFDIPVVKPIEKNQTTLFNFEEFQFSIYDRKLGHAPELDQFSHLKQLGRLLARLHAVGSRYRFVHRHTLSSQLLGFDAKEVILKQNLLPNYLQESYENLSTNLLQLIENQFSLFDNLPFFRIHGDFHLGNVLTRDNIFWIVDLDDCCNGPAIQDLWMLLSGEKHEREAQLSELVNGYNEFYDFDQSQLALVESLRTLRILNYAAWLSRRWNDPAFQMNFPWFNTPRYWEEHIQSLQEQLYVLQNGEEILQLH